jgi:hypothetical protein
VGGMMYSLRTGGTEAKFAMSNGRGDVVAQSNDAGTEDFGENTALGTVVCTAFTKESATVFDNSFSEAVLPGGSEGIDYRYGSTSVLIRKATGRAWLTS